MSVFAYIVTLHLKKIVVSKVGSQQSPVSIVRCTSHNKLSSSTRSLPHDCYLGAGFEDYSDHEEELGYFAAYSKMKK
jgi:hypothetical protein